MFDTLEHLPSFAALVELLVTVAEEQEATVVLERPQRRGRPRRPAARRTTWDEGAFAELRSMLPTDHAVWHQLALRGTAVVPAGHEGLHEGAVALTDDGAPVAFLAAFGPLAGELAPAVGVVQAEVAAERAARRAADAELAVLRARVAALGGS